MPPSSDTGEAVRVQARRRRVRKFAGFTLLEVLVAVAILSMSLTSMLSSQMAAMRATRYARDVSVAAFLAESKLLDLESQLQIDGWGSDDKTFDGDFSEEGWPDIRYECLIDFIEVPDFNVLQQAAQAGETDGDGGGGPSAYVATADDQAFAGMGMVWPIVKGAIEQSIRKSSCRVIWIDGKIEQDFTVETFWTDPKQLMQLPQAGGEVDETDDSREDGTQDPTKPGGAGGTTPGSTPSGKPGMSPTSGTLPGGRK